MRSIPYPDVYKRQEQYASASGVVNNYLRVCEERGVEPVELVGPSDSRSVFDAAVGLLFFIFCFHYCILYSLGDNPVWCLKYLPKKEGFGKFIK